MVNKKIDKNIYSHEMTDFGSESPSDLHCTNWYEISGLFHRSVFESPAYRVHNGQNSKSPITEFSSHEQVQNAVPQNHPQRRRGINTHTHHMCIYLPTFCR